MQHPIRVLHLGRFLLKILLARFECLNFTLVPDWVPSKQFEAQFLTTAHESRTILVEGCVQLRMAYSFNKNTRTAEDNLNLTLK